jgi:hypothetical protein
VASDQGRSPTVVTSCHIDMLPVLPGQKAEQLFISLSVASYTGCTTSLMSSWWYLFDVINNLRPVFQGAIFISVRIRPTHQGCEGAWDLGALVC